ncbi:unnamed protein product [Dovyalis caffra]|uniref:Uncharacterized protein n=1 Tax=Dovyalis caffra TaxID=77055 RepID=A0AAV1RWH0_9ROSI|nr:unnamed protein product [Dovyalis caffra]
MFQNTINAIVGCCTKDSKKKIKGTVVLMKKKFLDFDDLKASVLERVHEFVGQGTDFNVMKTKLKNTTNSNFLSNNTIFNKKMQSVLDHLVRTEQLNSAPQTVPAAGGPATAQQVNLPPPFLLAQPRLTRPLTPMGQRSNDPVPAPPAHS